MSVRGFYVFKHDSELGNAPANKLFELITVKRKDESRPARAFADYEVKIGETPQGVKAAELV